jgi:hypothetical protein
MVRVESEQSRSQTTMNYYDIDFAKKRAEKRARYGILASEMY